MNVSITLLLYLISFHSGHTQIISPKDADNYLNSLATLMWRTLKDYGISNLPDVDTKVPYNISKAYGYNLVGNLYFEDGFIMDISKIALVLKPQQGPKTTVDKSTMLCYMKFDGLRILRDFRYESDNGHITDRSFGSVVIALSSFQSAIMITKYFENNTLDARFTEDSEEYQLDKKFLQFYPENGLTMRLQKNNLRPPVLSGLWKLWKPIFSNFLEDIASKVEYPPLIYEF